MPEIWSYSAHPSACSNISVGLPLAPVPTASMPAQMACGCLHEISFGALTPQKLPDPPQCLCSWRLPQAALIPI